MLFEYEVEREDYLADEPRNQSYTGNGETSPLLEPIEGSQWHGGAVLTHVILGKHVHLK
jgi:hypothetical protein